MWEKLELRIEQKHGPFNKIYDYICGVPFRASSPCYVKAKKNYKTNLYMYVPQTCRAVSLNRINPYETLWAPSEEELAARIRMRRLELLQEQEDTIFGWIRDGKFPGASLELICYLRWEWIVRKQRWGSKRQEMEAIWRAVLHRRFGWVPLTRLRTPEDLMEIMEGYTHRTTSKHAMTEEEATAWKLLERLFAELVTFGIMEKNPAEGYASNARQVQQAALKNLARRNLSWGETRVFIDHCLNRLEEADVYGALLLCLLTGMEPDQVCALNLEDWQSLDGVSWVSVIKEYTQRRRSKPEISTYLRDQFSFRRIPCTPVIEVLLAQIVDRHRRSGAEEKCHLLSGANGKRLTPDELKKTRKSALKCAINPIDRPKLSERKLEDDTFSGDLLRSTAEYYFRTVAGLNPVEINVLLGRNPKKIYAAWYVNWGDPAVLHMLCAKMARWHSSLLSLGEPQISGQAHLIAHYTAQAGGELEISLPNGGLAEVA